MNLFITRKTQACATLVVGAAAMLFTATANAAIINVPADHATIQAAVTAANPNDTIIVGAGTYIENVTILKPLLMKGAQAGVDARGRVASETIVVPSVPGTATFTIAFSSVSIPGTLSIDGFTFSGGSAGTQGCIFTSVGPNNGMQILNNRFVGYSTQAIWFNRGATDMTIDKNVMDGSNIAGGSQAIFFNGPQLYHGLYFTNNWVINNPNRAGIFVDGNNNVSESATRAPLISGNLFNGNSVGMNLGSRSFGKLGLPVLGTYAGTISDNVFSNHAFDGVQGGMQHCLITGNTFQGNGRNGLALTSFSNLGNDRGAQNCKITNNQFLGNGFTLSGAGISCSAHQFATTISSNHINGNYFAGNLTGARYINSTTSPFPTASEAIDMEGNYWGSATGPTDVGGVNSTVGCTTGPAFVANLFNPGGTGNTIDESSPVANSGIDYCPFAAALPSLSITPVSVCYTGSSVIVKIRMAGQNDLVVGGQFFLQYDQTRLDFVSADPGSAPFLQQIYESVNEPAGTIDYAVGVFAPNPGTIVDTDMVVLTFNRIGDSCSMPNLVSFRAHTPTTQLTNFLGDPLSQFLFNLPTISIDTTPPSITAPTNITVNADAGGCTAFVTVPALVASDTCSAVTISNDSPHRTSLTNASGTYPSGTTLFTWTVTDACGNFSQVNQSVTVNAVNEVVATVELKDVDVVGLTRCIRFEFYNGVTTVPISQDVIFNTLVPDPSISPDEVRGTVTLLVPCASGPYTCVTARDVLHTLRRTVNNFTPTPATAEFRIVGTQYLADFSTAGPFDDSLIGGNANDDRFIDILDFGVFAGQYATDPGVPGGNTVCPVGGLNADFSGDGTVFVEDYTFISGNFLLSRESNCDGSALTDGEGNITRADGPITRISARELQRRGMPELIKADFNHDGWLDTQDIAVFFNSLH